MLCHVFHNTKVFNHSACRKKIHFHTKDAFLTIFTETFLESQRDHAAARKMMDSTSNNAESNDVHENSIRINEPLDHTLSGTFVLHFPRTKYLRSFRKVI